MRTIQMGLARSLKDGLTSRFQQPNFLRILSTNALQAADENTETIHEKFDQMGKGQDSFGSNWFGKSERERSRGPDGLDESLESLQDGTLSKLEKAATSSGFFPGGDMSPLYGLNDKMDQIQGDTRERFNRRIRPRAFQVTTEEVLRRADFRDVRFLANFITEGGIIIKRKQTRISATAQRKIAREIKKARSFGLLPFTTQGTKPFKFGTTMEDREEDYEYENYGAFGQNNMQPIETESLRNTED